LANYSVRCAAQLQHACNHAEAGDTIAIYSGLYDTPSVLRGRAGQPGRPIEFRAGDEGWICGGQTPDPFWGGTLPSADAPRKPDVTDFAFLLIDKCRHIVIDGLKVRRCWPSILSVKDSSHLQIRDCALRNATYAIFVKGPQTSHLLIENNDWQQDDSSDHDLWYRLDWRRAHGDEGSDGLFRYFNGGFLSAKGIAGKTVVRGNRIRDAFNGVRMKADSADPGQVPQLNADVHIVNNDFIRIRDNPIEPEVFAYNWHVRHNRILDCHAWFSFDGVTGGFWYFYGNTGDFRSRQGSPDDEAHTMGRVLKLSYRKLARDPDSERVPAFPWFVFNNSWHLRCPLIGGRNDPLVDANAEGPDFTAHLDFFNNAFEWCSLERHGPWVCEHAELFRNFDLAGSPDTRFDYDICNRRDFFDFLAAYGQPEQHGTLASRPIFDRPATGIFRLAVNSEAASSGAVRTVAVAGGGRAGLRAQSDGSLNRGAEQDYGLVQVPDLEAQTATLVAAITGSATGAWDAG
jgi:hypothetical protein